MSEVIAALEALSDEISSKIDKINRGGCCVFASMAYPHLKGMGLKPKIRVSDDPFNRRKTLGNLRKKVEDTCVVTSWWRTGMRFWHVLNEIEIDGKAYFFDVYGVVEREDDTEPFCNGVVHRGQLTHDEAVKLAANVRGWNQTFDRGQIDTMNKLLEKGFKKIMTEFN